MRSNIPSANEKYLGNNFELIYRKKPHGLYLATMHALQ